MEQLRKATNNIPITSPSPIVHPIKSRVIIMQMTAQDCQNTSAPISAVPCCSQACKTLPVDCSPPSKMNIGKGMLKVIQIERRAKSSSFYETDRVETESRVRVDSKS